MKPPDKLWVGVVVPILLAFEEAVKALESIRTSHIWTPYIAPQWKKNHSISYVWNLYSKAAMEDGCDYILIMNDDVILAPDCIDNLVDELIANKDLLLVSGESTHIEGEIYEARPLSEANLNFSLFMIKPEIFEIVGEFDENFYPAYFEDNDYHYRMQLLRRPAYGISNARFFHAHSVTSNRLKEGSAQEAFHENFRKARSYYIRKWGGTPGKEKYTIPFNRLEIDDSLVGME